MGLESLNPNARKVELSKRSDQSWINAWANGAIAQGPLCPNLLVLLTNYKSQTTIGLKC